MSQTTSDELVCWRVMCTNSRGVCRFVGYRMLPKNAKARYYSRRADRAEGHRPVPALRSECPPRRSKDLAMSPRYFHGGVPGLRGEILPPSRTGAPSNADYMPDGSAPELCRRDRVYLTTLYDAALIFAAGAPSDRPGWIYEVRPVGDVEPDADYLGPDGESVCARRARIVRVVKRLSLSERLSILRALEIA